MTFAKIVATGSFLPATVVTNADLEQRLDTSDEWIAQRTGIRSRHIASDGDNAVTMGVKAARQALVRSGWQPADIELIIVATCTPEQMFPATACLIQRELDIPACMAFDISAACSGFIYALHIAQQFIASGQIKRALVLGSEAMSKALDWNDRSTCVLFGDGAGAVLLEAADQPGILASKIVADGQHKDLLYLNNARMATDSSLRMQGNSIFKLAVNALGEIAESTIAQAKLTAEDIDWIIPHQANLRIIQATAKKLGISMDKVIVTVSEHANTSGASIPLALDVAISDGRVKPGQNLLLEAFGGGLTWGAVLVKY